MLWPQLGSPASHTIRHTIPTAPETITDPPKTGKLLNKLANDPHRRHPTTCLLSRGSRVRVAAGAPLIVRYLGKNVPRGTERAAYDLAYNQGFAAGCADWPARALRRPAICDFTLRHPEQRRFRCGLDSGASQRTIRRQKFATLKSWFPPLLRRRGVGRRGRPGPRQGPNWRSGRRARLSIARSPASRRIAGAETIRPRPVQRIG